MYETPILFRCVKCGYEDLPENFNGIQCYTPNSPGVPMRVIRLQCPNCSNALFFTHFTIYTNPELIDFNECRMSMGHGTPNKWKKSELGENSE